ncbi:biotin--[acetyl-CoA-carboxylase] ligase [Cryobacterium adonitolivorans]|uniref:biotin--[biotin carboxyl-carrier protein] ligase n=1 Tax=Cryobacterium adonitolivorans TaxID=1259189 RepID=A0A4R8W9X8_9MICO|nr:biotin--[acetyl-CoA-carboxylase] ligase [Cryobacterium adonitolivorans]TFC05480.1 biotin--[acetyl-CoA-carboxylase] ligase [Cryobacterium adonitolivorans]
MEFPISRGIGARFEYLDEAGSTNDVLVTRATGPDAPAWPDLSVIVTDNQTSGRGRLGRTWLAPSGKSLAVSVLLRPRLESGLLPANRYGWFPLLAGAAMTLAVRSVVHAAVRPPGDEDAPRHEVALKWPNDVLIDGYKVSGILSELLPDASGLCIGAGLNLSLDEHDLPTLTSTSLMLVTGSIPDPDTVLAAYLSALRNLTANFLAAGADPVASGLHAEVSALCGTLGTAVRVELPGGHDLVGTAVGLDPDGRLIVEDQANGELQAVAAGDVTHLRW